MISVVVYGRNDAHGYNLHKRASISLNCIAEVLTCLGDEIIFVDCNTPDDMPTFPEAIQDLLTCQTRKMLRIFRIRPAMYEKYRKGSPLLILESLCRNVGIRRSNPSNRWILSTNTDIVIVPRETESFSDISIDLPDGFYELPRFEVPETLWESLDRNKPDSTIKKIKQWGLTLHLNEVVIAEPYIRFDGPGDFQFMLRKQIFSINGFNEEMILGFHQDSNICKRFYLLNGETKSLIDYVFAYHCSHTRHSTYLHCLNKEENSKNKYVNNINSPYLTEQKYTWGLPDENIEEIHLNDEYINRCSYYLENLLPVSLKHFTEDLLLEKESFNHGLLYDNLHVFPYLANYLINLPSDTNIGYLGCNSEILRLLVTFMSNLKHRGSFLVDKELFIAGNPHELNSLSMQYTIVELEQLITRADIFIFDLAMMNFPKTLNSNNIYIPAPSYIEDYKALLHATFMICAKHEHLQIKSKKKFPRKFIFIASQHTWFEIILWKSINITFCPYNTHIRHGYLKYDINLAEKNQSKNNITKNVAPEHIIKKVKTGQINAVTTIGIDIRTLTYQSSNSRGIGHYTINHLNAVISQTPQWKYILYLEKSDSIEQNNCITELRKYPNVIIKTFLDASPDEIDIFHIPDPMSMLSGFDSPFLKITGKNTTVLFHDLIPIVLNYINTWECGARDAYNTRLEQLKRSKAFILTNSEYTRSDLNKYLNIHLDRMKAVMAGLNCAITHRSYTRKQREETLKKYNLREPFFLYVGALDPHKNFVATANALIAMNKTKKYTSQLAVIGKFDPYTRVFKEQLETQGVKEIIFTDFVPREELEQLYSIAVALVFPSQYEGFGFPVLEAMANGCPVITSNVTSIPEVAGDAALLFDPSDINGIAGGMLFLLENKDERAKLIEKGYKQAQKFTWEKTAARTIEIWEEILNKGTGLTEIKKGIPLLWLAPFLNPSGYTSEAFAFVQGLLNKTDISIANISNIRSKDFIDGLTDELKGILKNNLMEKPDVKNKIVICHFPAYAFSKDKESLYTIGRTMFETDRIPSDWVDKCNIMDEIWVPSKFNFNTFKDAGVKKEKLVIMPEPVDTDFFNPDGVEPYKIKRKAGFNFLSVFEWSQRKGWPVLLEAYFREFTHKDNVCLFLKTYLLHKPDEDAKKELKEKIISFAESIKLDISKLPKFELITQQLPFKDLPSFYKAFDCLVIPSHGEGWGRPHCEAMSMELPVIATGWSGNTEFMKEDNSYLIDVEELVEIKDTEISFYQGHRWAKPSVKHLVELMRHVYENPEVAKEKGKKARQDMISSYSCEVIGNKVLNRLNEIQEIINKRQEIMGMTDLKIFWEGSQFVYHSLALINRELCLQLIDRGFDVTIIPYENHQFKADTDIRFHKISERLTTTISRTADIHVRHQWPPKFTAPPAGGHWVIIQPWEYGRLRKEWVEPMRELIDEIWIPSNFVRKSYIESGIQPEKVFVVPNGFNPEIFNPSVPPFSVKTDKKFKFLFVGGTIWRKGADILVNAYIKTFTASDDVCLIIKDIGHDSFYKGMGIGEQLKKIQENPSMPEIIYIKDFLSEKEMAGLYTACDCLLHPYRGEGFAFPVLEAMACGKPVIVTKGGATDDFCKEEFTLQVDAEWIKIKFPDMELVGGEGMVLEPSMDSLMKHMRDVYENYPSAMKKAAKALEFVKARYTWDKIGDVLVERINKLRNKPVLRYTKINTLIKKGENFFTDGNMDEAMKCFSAIIDIEYSSGKAHSHMATLYWKKQDRVNALKHIKEAIKFAPYDADVVWNYGQIMMERGQKSDAFKAYKEYLSKNPHDEEIKSLSDKLVKDEEIRKPSSQEKKKKDKKKKKK